MGADRKYAWQDEIQSEYHVCSAGCAIGLYNRFMKNVTQGIPLVLVNESNIGLGVREDLKKGAKEISIAYMRIDPSQAPSEGEGFNKQMAPVYSRIKKDLARRKIKFKEEFENVV